MNSAEMESRITALEADVALLKEQLEESNLQLSVRRGLESVDAGRGKPAEQVVETLRKRFKLPTT